jgi:hypothetical protein
MNRHRSLSMTNIRQRKADQSPQSGGRIVNTQNEEMMRIVIEPEEDDNHHDNDDDNLDFESYHYTPQPPRMIPDKQYKDFMQGRTSKRKEASIIPTGPECASLCIGFSWVAVAFLVSQNVVLKLYIHYRMTRLAFGNPSDFGSDYVCFFG